MFLVPLEVHDAMFRKSHLFTAAGLCLFLLNSASAQSLELGRAHFYRGDSNHDKEINISDGIATLGFLFLGTGVLPCLDAADANDSGSVDIADAVFTFNASTTMPS